MIIRKSASTCFKAPYFKFPGWVSINNLIFLVWKCFHITIYQVFYSKLPYRPAALVYAPPYFMLVYLPVVGLIAKLVYWGSRTIPAIPGQIPFPLFSFRMGRGRLVAWGDLALDFCQPYPFSYSS